MFLGSSPEETGRLLLEGWSCTWLRNHLNDVSNVVFFISTVARQATSFVLIILLVFSRRNQGGNTTFGDIAATDRIGAMVYTITLTNPLASGHDGSWKLDLLMEAVVGTPAETPGSSLANGDPPTQAVGGDHQGGDGGVGGTPTGANGGGAGASADASSSQQQPPTSDNEEVDDISSDDDDDDDDGDGGCVDGGDVPDTSAQDADLMDASEISEDDDEDMDDRDSVVSDNEDALIGTLHQPGGTEPRSTAAGEVAEGVGNGARTDGAAAVDMMSSGAKGRDQPGGRVDLSPQAAESSGGVEHEAEGPQGGPAATPAAPVSTEAPPAQQQQQQQQQMLVVDLSSEDETITQAYTERRDQPGSPSATQLPGLSRPGDRAGRRRTRTSPPPSPPASPARSSSSSSRSSSPESVTSRQSAGSVGDDSDSAFDGSDENSSASDVETEDLDSDDYETDILPPTNCFQLHQDRRTYKKALCLECYKEYVRTEWVMFGIPFKTWCNDPRAVRFCGVPFACFCL